MFLPAESGSPGDFDYFIGDWDVRHRRLKSRLTGCTEWEHFCGRNIARKILGGFGNVDDNLLLLPEGTYRAATLRSFDPRQNSWSNWWLDGRKPGSLDVPVVGQFVNDVGTFLTNDVLGTTPIVVRFVWTAPSPDRPGWEQAFSADGGHSCESNWVMEFTRRRTSED